jgi:hypothetical protein
MEVFMNGAERRVEQGKVPAILLGCVLVAVLFAGCGRRVLVEQEYSACSIGTVGLPLGAFEGASGAEMLDSLRLKGMLPDDGIARAIRLPEQDLYFASSTVARTAGPRLRDPEGFRLRQQQVAAEGWSRTRPGLNVAAFADVNGDVVATHAPAPREFFSARQWRTAGSSADARQNTAERLVQQAKFHPAFHDGCRIASWVIVPVTFYPAGR